MLSTLACAEQSGGIISLGLLAMPLLWQARSPSVLFAVRCYWLMAASSPGSLCLLQHGIPDTAPACIDPWALLMPDTGVCTLFLLNFIRFLQAVQLPVNGHPFPPAY